MNNCIKCGARMIPGIMPSSKGWCSAECDISTLQKAPITVDMLTFILWPAGKWITSFNSGKNVLVRTAARAGTTILQNNVEKAETNLTRYKQPAGLYYIVRMPRENNGSVGVTLREQGDLIQCEPGATIPSKWYVKLVHIKQ